MILRAGQEATARRNRPEFPLPTYISSYHATENETPPDGQSHPDNIFPDVLTVPPCKALFSAVHRFV